MAMGMLKLAGLAAMGVGALASLASSIIDDKKMEVEIDRRLDEKLAEREKGDSEE